MILNCVAIDDEPPALTLLKRFITQTSFLHLSAGFTNGVEALEYISTNRIDLVFADILMPDLTGIELAEQLAKLTGHKPALVFVTAYDEFAVEGFRLNVTDYILKPFNYRDFLRTANKALSWYELQARAAGNPESEEEHIFLRVNHQSVRINTRDISYIEGLKDYARIHLPDADKSILSLVTLKALEEKLPSSKFMRIHKSFIIALDRITALNKNSVNIGELVLPVSSPYKTAFEAFADSWR